jgi:hypothetical protein
VVLVIQTVDLLVKEEETLVKMELLVAEAEPLMEVLVVTEETVLLQ